LGKNDSSTFDLEAIGVIASQRGNAHPHKSKRSNY
jgi:hypothetical protein